MIFSFMDGRIHLLESGGNRLSRRKAVDWERINQISKADSNAQTGQHKLTTLSNEVQSINQSINQSQAECESFMSEQALLEEDAARAQEAYLEAQTQWKQKQIDNQSINQSLEREQAAYLSIKEVENDFTMKLEELTGQFSEKRAIEKLLRKRLIEMMDGLASMKKECDEFESQDVNQTINQSINQSINQLSTSTCQQCSRFVGLA